MNLRSLRTLRHLTVRTMGGNVGSVVVTVVAVAAAVAFFTGSLLFSAALNSTMASLMTSEYENADVIVRPGEGRSALPAESVDAAARAEGVAAVNVLGERSATVTVTVPVTASVTTPVTASVTTPVTATDGSSAPLRSVTLRAWYPAETTVGTVAPVDTGRAPGPGEVLVNHAALKAGLAVGDTLRVDDGDGPDDVTVSGTFTPAQEVDRGTGGGVVIGVPADDYLRRSAHSGVSTLLVDLFPGAPTGPSVHSLTDLLTDPVTGPPEVRTGTAVVSEARETTSTTFGFLRYLLPAISGISLLAAMFIIANTFTMTVAQRIRATAVLRAVGVSRNQVSASVLAEALVSGFLGSSAGVLAGVGSARALLTLADRRSSVPTLTSGDLTAMTILLPLILGVTATLISAGVPAFRASRVAPLAALRAVEAPPQRTSRSRAWAGAAFGCVGVSLCLLAFSVGGPTSHRAALCGSGAALAFLGIYLASPVLLALSLGLAGRLGRRHPAIRLACAQATRSPDRTAGAAFALTLGLSLVTVTGMFGASVDRSVTSTVDDEVTADYVVASPEGIAGATVPGEVVTALADLPGVAATYKVAKAPVLLGPPEEGVTLATISDGDPTSAFDLGETTGDLDLSGGHGVSMSESFAQAHGWRLGDGIEIGVPGQALTTRLPLQGTYAHSRLLGDIVVSSTAFWQLAPGGRGFGGHRTLAVAVTGDPGTDSGTLHRNLQDATVSAPAVAVQTPEEFAGHQTVLVDRTVTLIYALSALAVAVAGIGVVNTLLLSVTQRRREIGVLRSVGASRRFIRQTVTAEAVLTSVYGGLTGVLTGLGSGAAVLGVLGEVGLTTVAVRWEVVVAALVGSVAVGALSALLPAVRAARIPPLEAVAD